MFFVSFLVLFSKPINYITVFLKKMCKKLCNLKKCIYFCKVNLKQEQ